ncbi:hypothetical protein HMPREF1987_00335 [Peptostreptococcaceae bacterium oral taxon 113 str. W5053]|nr:hypothetical protein HMPREF1987_00335 [Peptostreptococcaceae bacterium oral taxon 113 str. W5053]
MYRSNIKQIVHESVRRETGEAERFSIVSVLTTSFLKFKL